MSSGTQAPQSTPAGEDSSVPNGTTNGTTNGPTNGHTSPPASFDSYHDPNEFIVLCTLEPEPRFTLVFDDGSRETFTPEAEAAIRDRLMLPAHWDSNMRVQVSYRQVPHGVRQQIRVDRVVSNPPARPSGGN